MALEKLQEKITTNSFKNNRTAAKTHLQCTPGEMFHNNTFMQCLQSNCSVSRFFFFRLSPQLSHCCPELLTAYIEELKHVCKNRYLTLQNSHQYKSKTAKLNRLSEQRQNVMTSINGLISEYITEIRPIRPILNSSNSRNFEIFDSISYNNHHNNQREGSERPPN